METDLLFKKKEQYNWEDCPKKSWSKTKWISGGADLSLGRVLAHQRTQKALSREDMRRGKTSSENLWGAAD